MITLQLIDLIASRKTRWGRNVTLTEISSKSGISRMTLHRMLGQADYSYRTHQLDKLCAFFECEIQDLVRYVPPSDGGTAIHHSGAPETF